MNPSRRGVQGQLVAYLTSLGVEAITGKPYKPTTQGKNERFHQTLFRFLDKQPLAEDLEQLQAQVDLFDQVYNAERPRQGLPGRMTPEQAWNATAKVAPPRPAPQSAAPITDGFRVTRVRDNGTIVVRSIRFQTSRTLASTQVYCLEGETSLKVFDQHGTLIIEHPWPARKPNTSAAARPEDANPKSSLCQRCPDT